MAVVTKRVGRRNMRATPAQKRMKTTEPRMARMRATRMAKMAMEIVITMKRPRGKPERAICEARKD